LPLVKAKRTKKPSEISMMLCVGFSVKTII
jgi:hypothetical protein